MTLEYWRDYDCYAREQYELKEDMIRFGIYWYDEIYEYWNK